MKRQSTALRRAAMKPKAPHGGGLTRNRKHRTAEGRHATKQHRTAEGDMEPKPPHCGGLTQNQRTAPRGADTKSNTTLERTDTQPTATTRQ